jgi:hypothetical protein
MVRPVAAAEWDGATLRTTYSGTYLGKREDLADAARDASWTDVLTHLDDWPTHVNRWRPGGPSWYTPLHQAAWHGADPSVVRRLLTYGPWLTLRTAAGDRPLDIALRGGHSELAGLFLPVVRNPVPTDVLATLQWHLHDLIRERVADLVDKYRLRLPELDVLTELDDPDLWFDVPGMRGGFRCVLQGVELEVNSWSRVVGGSGQTHRITAEGRTLTSSGHI